jgi:diguanylate cyclase (GGDEF)-like protein
VLPGSEQAQAIAAAERLRQRVEQLALAHEASTVAKTVTISVGVASLCPTEQESAQRLLSGADQALYGAKRGGRNRSCAAVFGTPGR